MINRVSFTSRPVLLVGSVLLGLSATGVAWATTCIYFDHRSLTLVSATCAGAAEGVPCDDPPLFDEGEVQVYRDELVVQLWSPEGNALQFHLPLPAEEVR